MLERISELWMKGRGNKGREILAGTSGGIYSVLPIWAGQASWEGQSILMRSPDSKAWSRWHTFLAFLPDSSI